MGLHNDEEVLPAFSSKGQEYSRTPKDKSISAKNRHGQKWPCLMLS